jgi:hypothetical protein
MKFAERGWVFFSPVQGPASGEAPSWQASSYELIGVQRQ